jgi:phage terminase small subunit
MPTYPFKLVCVHPFHNYAKGQELLDPEEIAAHMEDREHHFVKVAMTDLDRAVLKQMQDAAKADTEEALAKAAEGQTTAPGKPAQGRDKEGRYQA